MTGVPSDVQRFLSRYGDQKDDPNAKDNLMFYRNQLICQPDELLVKEVHDQ